MSTNTVKTWQCSILHHCWRCSFWHTLHSLVQETGKRKPWIFFTQNNLIHLSPTLNILSQKAQPFGRSNHCGPPKRSLVHHHMSAQLCRLHNSWWQDLINSPYRGCNPEISSVLLNISHGIHDKQHVGILLCLLSTWIHNMSSFLNELHSPV